MIEHIEELYEMINKKQYDIDSLSRLNSLIDCRFINVDLTFLIMALKSGDNEDVHFSAKVLKSTIQKVIDGIYGCR